MKSKSSLVLYVFLLFSHNAEGAFNFIGDSLTVTLNYSETNYSLFLKVSMPKDRLLYFRSHVLTGYGWPVKLSQGKVLTTWPSWKEAQQNEEIWAPYTDVFGYDIEADSPSDETDDVAQTIDSLLVYLQQASQRYGHTIKLSTGLNYNFGTQHTVALARSDEVHIHANHLLRIYPEKDPKNMNYVDWAVTRAVEVRKVNPNVGIQFAVMVSEMSVNQATQVAEALILEMKARGMMFDGFTMWAETDSISAFLRWLRGITLVERYESQMPLQYILYQNYPNPFNPTTTIRFSLPHREHVTLKVFDVLGREVTTLVDGELNAGEHSVKFDALGLSSGVYFYQLVSSTFMLTKKMLLLE